MACRMAQWLRLEKAAATSMDRMALSVLWSSRVWVSLWSSSAPEGRPMAYWCGFKVSAMIGVICLAIAVASFDCGVGVCDVVTVCDDVDVIHVGGCGRVG